MGKEEKYIQMVKYMMDFGLKTDTWAKDKR